MQVGWWYVIAEFRAFTCNGEHEHIGDALRPCTPKLYTSRFYEPSSTYLQFYKVSRHCSLIQRARCRTIRWYKNSSKSSFLPLHHSVDVSSWVIQKTDCSPTDSLTFSFYSILRISCSWYKSLDMNLVKDSKVIRIWVRVILLKKIIIDNVTKFLTFGRNIEINSLKSIKYIF